MVTPIMIGICIAIGITEIISGLANKCKPELILGVIVFVACLGFIVAVYGSN